MKNKSTLIAIIFLIAGITSVTASNGTLLLPLNNENALVKNETIKQNHVYVWEVVCNYGIAKGYASSLEKAEKMIALVADNDVYKLKIIQRGKVN